jgi:predicted dehydrogenase
VLYFERNQDVASRWKAAVMGCGSIAQALHLPGYLKTPNLDLVAACDPVAPRRKEAEAMAPGIRTYRDHREMLEAEELDIVSVASPNAFHAPQAIDSLNAGCHVILEKPAALSLAEIKKIKAAIKKNKRLLAVGFSHRFYSGNRKIHKLMQKGAIGEPFMIRMRLAHTGPYPGWAKDKWFYDPKLAGGGALLDMGIHVIDQAQWLIGPIKSVQAQVATLRKKIKVEDNVVMIMEFANGKTLGYLEAGWTTPAGFGGMEIMGDNGCIIEDFANGLVVTTGKTTPDLRKKTKLSTRMIDKVPNTGGWGIEVQEIVKAFRKGDDMGCNIDAGGSALAVALAAYESSRTGKRVQVKYKP